MRIRYLDYFIIVEKLSERLVEVLFWFVENFFVLCRFSYKR